MEPFIKHSGIVVPLDRMDVDTDQIIPKQFLKRIERTGFGEYLFYDWRYLDDGTPNPDFVLNKPRYEGASILLTRDNFGSGSSREHAPWSLKEYGLRSIIAPSFADIFYNNCFKNSILPIVLPNEAIDELFSLVEENIGYSLTVDLEKQLITDDNNKSWSFDIDPFKKDALLKGLDDISQTLAYTNYISEFESRIKEIRSWQLPKQQLEKLLSTGKQVKQNSK